jgi:hypothetical protein
MHERLAAVRLHLLAGEPLEEGDAHLVAATIEEAIARRSRALAARLRQEALRHRNEQLRLLAARYQCAGSGRAHPRRDPAVRRDSLAPSPGERRLPGCQPGPARGTHPACPQDGLPPPGRPATNGGDHPLVLRRGQSVPSP